MDSMIAIADVIDRIAGDRYQRLSDEDRTEVDDVLEAAAAWERRELPIEEFAKVGTIPAQFQGRPSSSYSRYVAMLSTPITDPRRMALRRAIDALLRFQGLQITTQGIFDAEDLRGVTVLNNPAGPRERPASGQREQAA